MRQDCGEGEIFFIFFVLHLLLMFGDDVWSELCSCSCCDLVNFVFFAVRDLGVVVGGVVE